LRDRKRIYFQRGMALLSKQDRGSRERSQASHSKRFRRFFQRTPAANSEPSYALTLIGLGHDFVGNEFTSLRSRQPFSDGRARFMVQLHNGRLFTPDRKECARKRILIFRCAIT
jgi:hypothetical protein